MMYFLFGWIVGVLNAGIVTLIALWQKPAVTRGINKTISLLRRKGVVIEPEDEDFQSWVEELKEE